MKKLIIARKGLPGLLLSFLLFGLLFDFCLVGKVYGHVGSPGVVYEGMAGPYRIMVNVIPPDVIPGTAKVSVFVQGQGLTKVTAQPVYWYSGDKGAPSPDEMAAVAAEPGRYDGEVWLMDTGTASVKVGVTGKGGYGESIVPVMAVATAKRDMEPALGWILAGLGILLFVLMVTVIGASVSDGTLPPGEILTGRMKRKRMITVATTALVCGLILYAGSSWWNSWARDYEKFMYRPYTATSMVQASPSGNILRLAVDSASLDKRWLSYVVPDHGKLMHLFLVRQGSLDVFAHLHPVRKDTLIYEVALPALPAGRYLVYADVVRWQGFASTITDTVDIPQLNTPVKLTSAQSASASGDPDNTYVVTNPVDNEQFLLADSNSVLCGKPGVRTQLPDGSSIIWENQATGTLTANKVYNLNFSVQTPDGAPAQLEPYLGMQGHAVVLRNDGKVFIHLHPVGTYSMASQQAIVQRMAADETLPIMPDPKIFRDSIDRVVAHMETMTEQERAAWLMPQMNHMAADTSTHTVHAGSMVSFPYAFPEPGNYRIWVQIKKDDKILTGAFDAVVKE